MSYEVIGDIGSLGQFASNRGYGDLIAAGSRHPPLKQLFETGESSDVPGVIAALNRIESPPDVKTTAHGLARMIVDQTSIMISDGLSG
jgi:hypothetical protein